MRWRINCLKWKRLVESWSSSAPDGYISKRKSRSGSEQASSPKVPVCIGYTSALCFCTLRPNLFIVRPVSLFLCDLNKRFVLKRVGCVLLLKLRLRVKLLTSLVRVSASKVYHWALGVCQVLLHDLSSPAFVLVKLGYRSVPLCTLLTCDTLRTDHPKDITTNTASFAFVLVIFLWQEI